MTIFYSEIRNFGDSLNSIFWQKAAPWVVDSEVSGTTYFGIGSLLNDNLLSQFPDKKILGSGAGYGVLSPKKYFVESDVVCVRGPLSADAMGIPHRYAIADPAILTPRLDIIPDRPGGGGAKVVFVPHHYTDSMSLDWEQVCSRAGVIYVSPAQDPVVVIQHIRSATLVIAEAMHAAILADAFRVSWIPVALTAAINEFKWRDFFLSLELDCTLQQVFKNERSALEALRRLRSAAFKKKRIVGKSVDSLTHSGEAILDSTVYKRSAFEAFPHLFTILISRKLKALSKQSGNLSRDVVLARKQDALLKSFTNL